MSTPIMKQYKKIKAEHKDFLVFFRLGDFYELFYEDAIKASDILGITLTKRVQKDETIPMSGVPVHTCYFYIAKLVKAGQKIALCEQVEEAANKKSDIIKREVVRIITPGTLVEDTLLDSKKNNFLMAIYGNEFEISIAEFDLSTNEFTIHEIETAKLKDHLEKTEPKEILIFRTKLTICSDYDTWKDQITIIQEFNASLACEKILNFFDLNSKQSFAHLNSNSTIATSMILDYLEHTQKQKLSFLKIPKKHNASSLMQLDKFTSRNLEITKTLQNKTYGSLLWLLDETCTAQGARLLVKFINNPITDIEKLQKRQQKIEFFLENSALLLQIRKNLKSIPDFERLFIKVLMDKASSDELLKLAIGIKNLNIICKTTNAQIPDNVNLIQNIISAISATSERESKTYFIKENFDQELDEWKNFEKKIDEQIIKLEDYYKKETKIANLRIKNTSNFGYIVEINIAHKDKLDYNFQLIQELKNSARFTSKQLEGLNIKINECTDLIKTKENEIFKMLCEQIVAIANDVQQYANTSANLDLFTNFAFISYENNYVKPEIMNDNSFVISSGRHPILDKVFKNKGNNFVQNDCNLSECVMFMTGPNMAGKSTYLRQQSLIILLAQIGMFVPANSAQIGIVDHLFSRISTNDNLIEGTSTFMMEMIELSLTLNCATKNSFIVFDEVGRGTSSKEGMAIAYAILDYLINSLECRAIFATHYLELASIKHKNLQQKMMEIIENPMYFTHKLISGVAKKSYALLAAQKSGMPHKIIESAQKFLDENK